MFENLEHGNIKRRLNEDASFGLNADDIERETAEPAERAGEPSVSNLTRSPRKRKLLREEEHSLIVAAQAGDDKAMRRLIDAHVRWIKYHAGLRWDRSVRRNDPSAIAIDDLVCRHCRIR